MKQRLFPIGLVVVLLFTLLASAAGCGTTPPPTQYTLTITSTAGGDVTTPTEGTHTYNTGTVVNLTAAPHLDYHFVNWTGNGTVANPNSAITTITMNGNYAISANFGFDMAFIDEVPDESQPPTQTLVTTNPPTNYCAPMAVANVLEYWDDVANHANAQNVTAGLVPKTVAEYLGYFMDTNNSGSPDRVNNPGWPGTHNLDVMPGTTEYIRWDATHPFPILPDPNAPALPPGKLGYDWGVVVNCDINYNNTLNFYKNEIDNGRPLVVAFDYWNPVSKTSFPDPQTGETINVFVWGNYTSSSLPPNPPETWTYGHIGHAVTGVGYKLGWDPDGAGPIPLADWVIVHDNWDTTPENVAIPWANWMCLWHINPSP